MTDLVTRYLGLEGFQAVAELRGLLSVPAGADEAVYERAGYVTALRAANSHVGPW